MPVTKAVVSKQHGVQVKLDDSNINDNGDDFTVFCVCGGGSGVGGVCGVCVCGGVCVCVCLKILFLRVNGWQLAKMKKSIPDMSLP